MRWAGIMSAAFLWAFCSSAGAVAQEMQDIAEVRSILREASALVPKIEELQQGSAAANIAAQQAAAGDLGGALTTIRLLNDQRQGSAIYCPAYALTAHGNWRVAMQIIGDLPKGASRAYAHSAVASQLAERGDFEDALAVARVIREGPDPMPSLADVLMRICAEQWTAGDVPGALDTLGQAVDAIEHWGGTSGWPGLAIAYRYGNLIQTLAATGHSQAASVVVERLYAMAAQERDPDKRQPIVGQLARSQAAMADFPAALGSIGRLPPGRERDAAMLSVIEEQARHGDPAGARLLATEIPQKAWDSLSLREFAYALGDAGDSFGALAMIEKIQGTADRAYALAQLALNQAEKSDASAALTAMLAMEASEAAGNPDPFVLEFIAVTRGAFGDFPGALQIINGLDDKAKVWPLWNVTEQMVAAGKKSEALALAHSQEAPHPRAYALMGTATEWLEEIEAASKKAGGAK